MKANVPSPIAWTLQECSRTGVLKVICGVFFGLFTAIPAEAGPPCAEALRFAAEGKAEVASIRLANDRSAKVTIAALGQLVSPREAGPALASPQGAGGTGEAMLRIIEIPAGRRGSIRLRFETADPAIRESVVQGSAFLARTVSRRWLPSSEIRVRALPTGGERAYATGLGGDASIFLREGVLDIPTAVHELAHHIEGEHRWVLEASKRFLARRARGGTPERLSELTGANYDVDEMAYRANWSTRGGDHYCGKFYGPSLERASATELVSMGLERLLRQPEAFFREDADYFLMLLLVLGSE